MTKYWLGKKRPDMVGNKYRIGIPSWCKNLSKETDERVRTIAKKREINISKEVLYQKYVSEKKSTLKIAKELNVVQSTITKKLKNYNIPRRTHSEATKNNPNGYWLNKKRPKEWNEKQSNILKKVWQNPEYRKNIGERLLDNLHNNIELQNKKSEKRKKLLKENPEFLRKILIFKKPNKSEKLLDSWLQEAIPNEFKFVGDGSVIIDGCNPDWIDYNGKKLIIELFGERWHELEEEQSRPEIFAKYGYKTLIIWYKELKNKEKVLNKINDFLKGVFR